MGKITSLVAERVRRGEGVVVARAGEQVRLQVAGWELMLSPAVAQDLAELLSETALDAAAESLVRRARG